MAYQVFTPEMLMSRGIEELGRSHEVMAQRHRLVELSGALHAAPYCHLWSPIAAGILKAELGLFDPRASVEQVSWTPDEEAQVLTEAKFHTYISAALPGVDTVIADGTWQQFVPKKKRSKNLPRIAVGSPAEVQELAADAGVHDGLVKIWDPDQVLKVLRY